MLVNARQRDLEWLQLSVGMNASGSAEADPALRKSMVLLSHYIRREGDYVGRALKVFLNFCCGEISSALFLLMSFFEQIAGPDMVTFA